MTAHTNPPSLTIAFPVMAIAFVILAPLIGFDASVQPPSFTSLILSGAMIVIMLGAVFAAVYHADVIAHRVGEPFGTLVLTLAVTIIEVALIELIVLTPGSSPALARDTVFAVIMIVCNGLVGLCVLWGGLRHHEQEFQASGASVYLSVLGALSILTLVLPNYTATTIGPYFSNAQLVFVSITTIILYVAFLFIQTSRHTDYFRAEDGNTQDGAHVYPSSRARRDQRCYALVGLRWSNPYCEKICSNSGNRSFQGWRSSGRRGHHHCYGGIDARKHHGGASNSAQ